MLYRLGIALLVDGTTLFVDVAGPQIAHQIADGASDYARLGRLVQLIHQCAAFALVGFARKFARNITPGSRGVLGEIHND